MLDTLSPARRRLVFAVCGLVAAALIAVGAAAVVAQDPPVDPVAQDELGPVLLVPGYGGNTRSLADLESALTTTGREVTVVELAGDGRGDLKEQAEVLDKAVEEALDDTDTESVDVVGYSAGGVIARYWVKELGGGSIARRVVTLGSPHHGTKLAGFASDLASDSCPTACLQLSPESDFMRDLNQGDETPEGPAWVSIWTTDDTVVSPPTSASLDGAVNFSVQGVCPRDEELTHSGLPRDRFVIAAVGIELGIDPPRQLTSGDCPA